MFQNRRGELVAAAALLGLGATVLVSVRRTPEVPVEDPLGPYGLPRVLAVGLIAVAVAIALHAWWAARHRTGPATAADPADPADSAAAAAAESVTPAEPATTAVPATTGAPAEPEPATTPRRRPYGALTIAATIGYVLLLPVLGFIVASVLFGVALLPVLGARSPRAVVLVPAGAVALLWLLFVYSLDVGLPTFLGR